MRMGTRSAPTVLNAAYLDTLFWDGRARSLEEQAKGPLTNPIEMGVQDGSAIAARIAAVPAYKERFAKVFGPSGVTFDNVVKAIAAYERTLVAADAESRQAKSLLAATYANCGPADVNRLLNQFKDARKLMQAMTSGKRAGGLMKMLGM